MVTLTTGIMFMLFTCIYFWLWGILRRWSARAPTACEVVDWLWWGETDVSELRTHGPTVHPRLTAMWPMVWWYLLWLTANSSTRALWQPPVLSSDPVSTDISGASTRMGKGNANLVYPSSWDFKGSLTCRKILRHGTSGFTSHPKEGVLRTFIALKKSIALVGFEPAIFGSCGKHTNHFTTNATVCEVDRDCRKFEKHWPIRTSSEI
jgi:hypothetical protein